MNISDSSTYLTEEIDSEKEIRDQFETNVFGTIRVMQAAIPHFREKRRGMIVNMSSISGLTVTNPSGIMYSASKSAIEAISEGLAMQLAPFNIAVLSVEPGLFRTNWLQGSYAIPAKEMTQDYVDGPVDAILQKYPTQHGKQAGDPAKAAKIIVDVATGAGLGADEEVKKCLRLPLGNDAIAFGRAYIKQLTHEFNIMEPLARSAVFDGSTS
jgi:NAD(P)-dependent dehydrogenase (short-subunit alcohol dehydrogenase family)